MEDAKAAAAALFKAGRVAAALDAYDACLGLLDGVDAECRVERCKLHSNLALCTLKLERYDASLAHGHAALVAGGLDAASDGVIETKLRCKILFRLSRALAGVGQHDAAEQAMAQVARLRATEKRTAALTVDAAPCAQPRRVLPTQTQTAQSRRAAALRATSGAQQSACSSLAVEIGPFCDVLKTAFAIDAGVALVDTVLLRTQTPPPEAAQWPLLRRMARVFARRASAWANAAPSAQRAAERAANHFCAPLLLAEIRAACAPVELNGTFFPVVAVAARLAHQWCARAENRESGMTPTRLCELHALWCARGIAAPDGSEALCELLGSALDAPRSAQQRPTQTNAAVAAGGRGGARFSVVASRALEAGDTLCFDLGSGDAIAERQRWRSMSSPAGVLMLAHAREGKQRAIALCMLHRHYHRRRCGGAPAGAGWAVDSALTEWLLRSVAATQTCAPTARADAPAAAAAAAVRNLASLEDEGKSIDAVADAAATFSEVLTAIVRCAKLATTVQIVDKVSLVKFVAALADDSPVRDVLQRAIPAALVLDSDDVEAEFAAWRAGATVAGARATASVAAMGEANNVAPWFLKAPRANNGEGVQPLTASSTATFRCGLRALRARVAQHGVLLLQRSPAAPVALLDGRKFDVRTFVLHSADGRVWLFDDAICYAAVRRRDDEDAGEARLRHVSNAAVQAAHSARYAEELGLFQRVASDALARWGWRDCILPKCRKVLRALFGAFHDARSSDGAASRGGGGGSGGAECLLECELLGVDFLLTQNSAEGASGSVDVSLLEVNALPRVGPGVHTSTIQSAVTAPMINGIGAALAGGAARWLVVQ